MQPDFNIFFSCTFFFLFLVYLNNKYHEDLFTSEIQGLNIFSKVDKYDRVVILFSLKFDKMSYNLLRVVVAICIVINYMIFERVPHKALKEKFFLYLNIFLLSCMLLTLVNNLHTLLLCLIVFIISFAYTGTQINFSEISMTFWEVKRVIDYFDMVLLVFLILFTCYYLYMNGVIILYNGQYSFSSYHQELCNFRSYDISNIFRFTKKVEY